MARVTYQALRSLKAGVSPNTTVDLDFMLEAHQREAKPVAKTQVALGGASETRRDRTDVFHSVTTSPVLEAAFDDFRQFLDSVDGGEPFTLDPYGTLASPVQPLTVERSDRGYKERRIQHRYLSATFTVRVIA